MVTLVRTYPGNPMPTLGADFERAIATFQRSMVAENLSPNTISSYLKVTRSLYQFAESAGMPLDPATITREHVEAYMAHLLHDLNPRTGQPYAPGSARSYYMSLHAFFKRLVDIDAIPSSPMERMRPPKVPQVPPVPVTDEQIKALLRKCEGKAYPERRDMAMFRLLADTGMRVSELTGLTTKSIDWDDRAAVVMGKGRKQRRCWFGPKTLRALDLYVNWARPHHKDAASAALWLGQKGPLTRYGVWRVLRGRASAAGIEEQVHPHMLRHFAAYAHLRANGSEVGLMRRLGWSSRDMVSRYTSGVADRLTKEEFDALNLGTDF